MSSLHTVGFKETLISPCTHGENLDDKLIDRFLRESSNPLDKIQSSAQLEIIHRLPKSITEMLNASERSTLLHSVRVSLMSRIGSEIMGFDERHHDLVELSGLTHDLGKQMPEINQLVHNGRVLNQAEREVVNKHAHFGFEMLYDSRTSAELNLRKRLGNFMGHVALDVLFSHSLAKFSNQTGVTDEYLANIITQNVISPEDASKHIAKPTVQLVALADVTDALISTGLERAYRLQRLTSEGRPAELDPATLPDAVGEIIDVPALSIEKIVPELTSRYDAIEKKAEYYVRSLESSQKLQT